ncbi:MAG: hypothetical protein AB1458_13140 [Bacteroidota bacterium]
MTAIKIIVTKEFLFLKVLLSLIYIVLELYYACFISQQYDYMRYTFDPGILKYLVTKIVFLLLLGFSWHLYIKSGFLYSVYLLLIFLFYIPNAILYSLGDFPAPPFVSVTFFVSFFLLSPYLKIRLPRVSLPVRYGGAVMLLLSILLLVPIVLKFGTDINLRTLLLSEIYETREVFAARLTGLLNYLYNLEAKTIIPAALAFFLIYRRYLLAGLLALVLLYLFTISGNKFVYFTSIIVIFFFYFGKDHVSKTANFFLLLFILFLVFPVIDIFLPQPLLSGIFVNRLVFIPSLLNQFYFDFFDGNPYFFADSNFFNRFVENPYGMPAGYVIAQAYWNVTDTYANNGIVSDGFMNLGYAGVALFSAIFAFLFGLFNSLNLHKGYYGLFFSYIFLILSVPLMSTFITGGILLFIILAVFVIRGESR